jgi:hypothetical protein
VNHPEAIADHFASALQAAPISFEPWRHVFIENVFPTDFYKEIEQAYVSSEALFQDQVHTGDRDIFTAPYEKRSEFRVSADPAERLAQGPVWDVLWDVLTSRAVFVAIKRALAEELMVRFDDYLGHPQFRDHLDPWLLATKHRTGYHLGPHTDREEKVITCIFNIAESDGLEDLGTALYTARQADFRSNGRQHFEFEKFDLAKVTPFKPNSALIFARQATSFHGVEPLTEENMRGSERRNVQFNLWDWGRRPE